MPRKVHIVPHTHWDREWYAPFQSFRLRLVDLLDDLLPSLDADPSFVHFLLDGQMAVIDDYLAVRPQARRDAAPPCGVGPARDRAVVHPHGRVPGVGRDDRAQLADGTRPRRGVRRRDGGRLPARHVRSHRADAAAVAAVRLRSRGRVARRACCRRQERVLVDRARRLDGASRVPRAGLWQRGVPA